METCSLISASLVPDISLQLLPWRDNADAVFTSMEGNMDCDCNANLVEMQVCRPLGGFCCSNLENGLAQVIS